jgi:hypothetical protein
VHSEEIHNSHTSANKIRIIKSRTVSLAGYVASMGRIGMNNEVSVGKKKERDDYEELDVGGG